MSVKVYLGLGSNLENREANLQQATQIIEQHPGVNLIRVSPYYRTAPWGKTDQPWFLNAVLEVDTDLNPWEVLELAWQVEKRLGRVRGERWGPRSIDVDVLIYVGVQMATPQLTLPHPLIAQRAFVLRPLADLIPELELLPGQKVIDLLQKLTKLTQEVLPWDHKP